MPALRLHSNESMAALDVRGELLEIGDDTPNEERPTIPVPRESGIQLRTLKVGYAAATVDVVLCDLSRDPRSEDFVER